MVTSIWVAPPHSWEGTDEDIVWHKWAIVDLGQTDPDRRGV